MRGGSDEARRDQRRAEASEDDRALYVISVAAELAGVHPQTLRIYERKGLLRPRRTSGNSRRYSARDIARLRMIQELTQSEGVNLAGVKRIMQMQRELERMRERIRELEAELARRPIAAPGRRGGMEIVPLHSVRAYRLEDLLP